MPLNTQIPQQIVQSTTTALSVKRGEAAMLVADLDKGAIVLMDGKTYGGIPMAREDVQIRAGSDAITVNDKEWAPLLGNVNIDINPEGFIENVVSPTDKVLGVGVDGKIATQLSVSYDETSGLFSLKGKDGETISSFTLVIPTGITPKSVALVENPEGQEPGLYLEFVFIDDDDVEIKLYANMDILKDVYTAGRGITISDDRVISVDEDAISGVIADDLIEESSGLKVVNDKLHLDDHASETPEYGLGDEDKYGHVRLADSGDSRATVQAGIAATPAAVKDVDDRAVHNEGDELISGTKTFVDTPKVTLPDGSTDDVASLTDVQTLVDGTVWSKRVDEIPEDSDVVTVDMPIGALVVTAADSADSGGLATVHQVVAQGDKKVLAEVQISGGSALATSETPGIVRPDGATTTVDEAGLLSALGGNLLLNSEEWITESGTWTAPVTGWYAGEMWAGGDGGVVYTNYGAIWGGRSGVWKDFFIYLQAGDNLQAVIGSGGLGLLTSILEPSFTGGDTSLGDITATNNNSVGEPRGRQFAGTRISATSASSEYFAKGGGIGSESGGSWISSITQAENNARQNAGGYFGAGGTAMRSGNNYAAGAGAQGSIHLCWHDPSKANGPVE